MSAVPLLEVMDLRISFAGREVVHGIGFEVQAGEKLALVGESGSGKTVSALSVLRLVPDAFLQGQAKLAGRDLLQLSEGELRAVRGDDVACIFQEPMTALNPLYTVGDQIAEVLTLKKGLGKAQAWQQAIDWLDATGIPEPKRRAEAYPHQLSGGQRQRAMIAMALAAEPKLLIADEPTTALDASLRGQILELLGDLQRRMGMAVLMITHDLHLVRQFADRVVVMEHGHLVEQGDVKSVFESPHHPYTRKLLSSRPQRAIPDINSEAQKKTSTTPVLAQDLTVAYPTPLPGVQGWFKRGRFEAVRAAGFQLDAGRTLGVVGESGSGKSTLALAALGLLPHEGRLEVLGQSWADRTIQAQRGLRRKVQVVFQDPFSSLSPRMTVEHIVGEGLTVHEPRLSPAERRARVVATLREVGLLQAVPDDELHAWLQRYPHEFSGGQRQRLAIARALVVGPELLVLDEPTSALDVTVQQQVIELLLRLQAQRHLTYFLITHDVDVIWAMAHEVMVMQAGEVVEKGPATAVLKHPKHPYTRQLLSACAPL